MSFLNLFKHLLPRAKAWSITKKKKLRDFFDGLTGTPDDVRSFYDDIFLDIFPETTREIEYWENQFGITPSPCNSTSQRRQALISAWKAQGGQSPRYIQDTLQNSGFDVYIHEWWEPGTEPPLGSHSCATPRDPGFWVNSGGTLLVNKILVITPDYIPLCGEAEAECGEPNAGCGNYFDFINSYVEYTVPTDQSKWPYFFYLGGATFGTFADIPLCKKEEFERFVLKIKPTQTWVVLLVNYI